MQRLPALTFAFFCIFQGVNLSAQEQATTPPPSTEEPESARSTPSLLERVFKEGLKPEQLASLGKDISPETLVVLMTPVQKNVARLKLKEIEERNTDPAELSEIEHGYQLLGASADIFRVTLRRQGFLPKDSDSQELTKAAATAYAEGRRDEALNLAAQALAKNPEDKAAYAILMLGKPKLGDKKINVNDPFGGTEAGESGRQIGGSAPSGAGERPPSAQAQASMRQAIQARRAGNLDETLKCALDAMRADPTSLVVQDVFRSVIEDRTKQMRRLHQTLNYLEQAVDAANAGSNERALALADAAMKSDPNPVIATFAAELRTRAQQAPARAPMQTPKSNQAGSSPPVVPVGAGSLLLALGALLWRSGGRDRTKAWWKDVKTSAGLGMAGLGAAGLLYGGWMALGAVSVTPPLALAGVGSTGGIIAVDGVAVSQGAIVTASGAKLATAGMSLAQSSGETKNLTRPSSSLKKPSAKDPELQNLINDLFKPQDRLSGGTAGAVRNELRTGEATAETFHSEKAEEYIRAINKLLRRRSMGQGPPLDPVDQATAEAIRADLQNALNIAKVGHQ